MSLLDDIAKQALDPAYADAAARRAATDPGGVRRPARRSLAIGGVLAATLLLVLAAVQTHRHAPSAERSRQTLLDQVRRETGGVSALERRLNVLRDRTQDLSDSLLQTTKAGSALAKRLDAADLSAGTVAATGPGLQVVVDDAPAQGGSSNNQVLDRDLQSLVNALWAAGAEAIAIDDQRVTAQTAIRQAGSSILVNFEPITRPYVITAIGDPVGMATSFGASSAVARMRTYTQVYGLQFRFARADSLTVPRAPGLPLRYAKPVVGRRTGEARQ
jgi:uncharacterized protein YlxW (UPF0749 family)